MLEGKRRRLFHRVRLGLTVLLMALVLHAWVVDDVRPLAAASPDPPAAPLKLIFIHHSCGENWLTDGNGGLGLALRDNHYFVSDTNYGWGPDGIGDNTDIGHWWDWFRGPQSAIYLAALFAESDQHSSYSRLATDPGGENQIVLFKSCYPNSHLGGDATDPSTTGDNPLRGASAYSDHHTVANAKGIYTDLLTAFAARQDRLFVVITAPPLAADETDAAHAANARALNNWLVSDWLAGYPHTNVAVFDLYNVLTSNGGSPHIHDAGAEAGNHHRWWDGAPQHLQTVDQNVAAYPSGDSHPTAAGNQKATAEFIPLLNAAVRRWHGGGECVGLTGAAISGSTTGMPDAAYTFTAALAPVDASSPITPTWEPVPATGQGTLTAAYRWSLTGAQRITLTAENCGGIVTATHLIHIAPPLRLYLPVILRGWRTATSPQLTPIPPSGERLNPGAITYLGAFRLPGGEERPETFAYGGNAMTFNPDGDPASDDGYSGSLFITGHDRLAYGELPDGGQIAEVAIPAPTAAVAVADLPTATFLQGFHAVAAGAFTDLEEIPKLGLQYLDHAETGPLLHLCWGQHLQPQDAPSHAWVSADLAAPDLQGRWFIGDQNLYSTNGYMFDIPTAWADAHTGGRMLATGRMRDGGQGGMGPALFAYRPWLPGGAPPASGTRLSEVTLLRYASADATPDIVHSLQGYQHPDEWEGGAWITTPEGDAVLFAGTKATGAKYWYGYIHPDGPEHPCVDAAVTDYVTCRLADGRPCPTGDFAGCCDEGAGSCVSGRGWWSSRFDAQFILYDPADLARVAAGELDPWAPQPYATLDIDAHLFLDPPVWDEIVLGWGDQRRYRIGAVAYDRRQGHLYVLETYADGGKPVVHVWRVGDA